MTHPREQAAVLALTEATRSLPEECPGTGRSDREERSPRLAVLDRRSSPRV
jgi:hypothetical protein